MANDSNKVISLGNLKVLKDYINKTGGATKELISEEMKTYLDEELIKASNNLSKEYEEEFKSLQDRIAEVETNGTPEELRELKLQLDALNANFNDKNLALDSLNDDLKRLSGDFSTLYEGIETGSVFSAGQLNEIIKTALIDKTVITDEMVSTPNVFTQKIVALIANFGHINAGSIDAGTIAGSNIESIHKIAGTNDPVWVINDEGDGWLAKKNIQWDKNGNVTFGPDVKITWASVEGADDILNDSLKGYSDDVKEYVRNYVIDKTDNAASMADVEAKFNIANTSIEETKQLIYDNEASAEEKRQALQESIDNTATALRAEYAVETQNLNLTLEAAKEGLEKAIAEGDEAAAKEFQALIDSLNSRLDAAYNEIGRTLSTVKAVEESVNKSLDPEQLSNLLAASLITETQVGPDFVKTPNVLAKEITALMGTFGNVDAADLTSNTIEGFTVQAPTRVRDEDGFLVYEEEEDPDNPGVMIPTKIKRKKATWKLNYDGSGYVGNENISWDEDGDVTLGDGVTIRWEKVTGAEDKLTSGLAGVTSSLNTAKDELEGSISAAEQRVTTAYGNAINDAKIELNKNISEAEARAKAAAEAKAAELTKSLNDMEDELDGLIEDLGTSNEELETLEGLLNTIAADSKLSPTEYNDMMTEISCITTDYNNLKGKLDTLNTYLSTWQSEINSGAKPNPGFSPSSMQISYTELTTKKGTIDSMKTYYENAARETVGDVNYVAISADYPLSLIPEYKIMQNLYLQKYAENVGVYTTQNRYGSKFTYLGDTGIYSGKIMGDQIEGLKMSGLSVEAAATTTLPSDLKWYSLNDDGTFTEHTGGTGPKWQIWQEGSGHLAKGNIKWDAEGNINLGNLGSVSSTGEGSLTQCKVNNTEVISFSVSGDDKFSFDTLCSKSIQHVSNTSYYTNWLGGSSIWSDLSAEADATSSSSASVKSVVYIKNANKSTEHDNINGFLGEFYIENDGPSPIWIRNHKDTSYPVFLDYKNGVIADSENFGTSLKARNRLAILIPAKTIFKFTLHTTSSGYYRMVPISKLSKYRWGGGTLSGDNSSTLCPYVVSDCNSRYWPTAFSVQYDMSDLTDTDGKWLSTAQLNRKKTINIPIYRTNNVEGFSVFINMYPNPFSSIVSKLMTNKTITLSTDIDKYAWCNSVGGSFAFGLKPKRAASDKRTYTPLDENSDGETTIDYSSVNVTTGEKGFGDDLTITYSSTGSGSMKPSPLKATKATYNSINGYSGLFTNSNINGSISIYEGYSGYAWMINVPEAQNSSDTFTQMNLYIQISEAILYLLYKAGTSLFYINVGISDDNGQCINEFTIGVSIVA